MKYVLLYENKIPSCQSAYFFNSILFSARLFRFLIGTTCTGTMTAADGAAGTPWTASAILWPASPAQLSAYNQNYNGTQNQQYHKICHRIFQSPVLFYIKNHSHLQIKSYMTICQ